jgi:glycosyltransferase involved in cell wall biosynthesis
MQKTSFDFEICIGEDGSNDGTAEICKDYASKYPDKIRLLHRTRDEADRKKYAHPAIYNFVETLKKCRGKYIAILEGDDYWTDSNKLQLQVDFLEANSDYSLCFHNATLKYHLSDKYFKEYEEKDGASFYFVPPLETTTIRDLAKRNFILSHSVVFRNSINSTLPDWFKESYIGDYPLFMLLSKYGKLKYIDRVMGCYRCHSDGMWSCEPKMFRLEKFVDTQLLLLKAKFDDDVKEIIRHSTYDNMLGLLKYYYSKRLQKELCCLTHKMIYEFPEQFFAEFTDFLHEKDSNKKRRYHIWKYYIFRSFFYLFHPWQIINYFSRLKCKIVF